MIRADFLSVMTEVERRLLAVVSGLIAHKRVSGETAERQADGVAFRATNADFVEVHRLAFGKGVSSKTVEQFKRRYVDRPGRPAEVAPLLRQLVTGFKVVEGPEGGIPSLYAITPALASLLGLGRLLDNPVDEGAVLRDFGHAPKPARVGGLRRRPERRFLCAPSASPRRRKPRWTTVSNGNLLRREAGGEALIFRNRRAEVSAVIQPAGEERRFLGNFANEVQARLHAERALQAQTSRLPA